MPLFPRKINLFSGAEKFLDIRRCSIKLVYPMKNDNVTTALNLALAVLVLLSVFFALRTVFLTRSLRGMQALALQANQANGYRMAVTAIAQDTIAYSQKYPNPEIQRILGPLQAKPTR